VADDNVTLNASTGKANHVNFIRNVSIKAAYDNDATSTNNWDNAAGTCSGVKCHGGNAVNWTADIGKVSCANCHVVASAETDDFGTGTPASMFNNNVTASIDNTEWMYSGHGRDTGTFDCTTNVAPNLVGSSTGKNKCKFCHDDTVAHGVTANPFRLANNNWNGKGWNGNCFICHATSAPGYQPPQDNASLTYALKVGTLTSGHSVDNNHFNYGTTSNARHSTTYNGGQFCWDCHDPHGDRSNSATGNIVMIGKKVNRATDNTGGIDLGIPVGGTLGADRVSPKFERRTNGIDFASTDNVAPFDGICEVCHLAASGVTHFYTAASNNHSSSNCIGCHSHDTGFKGSGGSNQEQFFDNSVRVDNAANYKDISGHRIFSTTTLASRTFNTETECYSCHGVSGTNRYSNECLKCHWENRSGAGAHPSGTFEWAVPNGATLPSSQFGSSGPASDAFCLQCHTGAGGATFALNGVNPPLVIPAGETWSATTASGHGTTTTKLSAYSNAGPAALSCRACHYSTGAQSGGTARDNKQPGFHASVNHKLVTNLNYAVREYPDPADNTAGFSGAGNINLRSGLMDSYCATACHRNTTNGTTSDDNVIDHTWDLLGGQTRSGAQSHPSNFLVTPGAYYKNATQLYYSNYTSGGFPGSGNVVCVTCHDPHGGGAIKNAAGTSLTGGAKNMLRLSPADNVSTLCKECHK
jgi:predicted CxxxxCH...CXXCH cytochrome family protein